MLLWWTVLAALAADPVAKAWNAYELELWPEAKAEADTALQQKLNKAQRSTALLVSATARQHLGDDAEALEAAQACVALGGRDEAACGALVGPLALDVGKAAFNEGVKGDASGTERAIEAMQAYVATAPGSFDGQYLLGRALRMADRHADAVGPLQAAVALEAKPAAVGALLFAQAEAGQLDEGLAAARAHPQGPETVNGLLALGQALQADRPDDAISLYRAAVAADGSSAVAHKLLGVALVNRTARLDDADAARAALEEGRVELEAALAGKPDDKSILGALAQVTKALGDAEAAADYEERAK